MFNVRRTKIAEIFETNTKNGYQVYNVVLNKTRKNWEGKSVSYSMVFSAFGKTIDQVKQFKVGDVVNIKFRINSKKLAEHKYFNVLSLIRIEKWVSAKDQIEQNYQKKTENKEKHDPADNENGAGFYTKTEN